MKKLPGTTHIIPASFFYDNYREREYNYHFWITNNKFRTRKSTAGKIIDGCKYGVDKIVIFHDITQDQIKELLLHENL